VDGRLIGKKAIYLIIQKGRIHTVEVKKTGFAITEKTYYNSPEKDTPPLKDFFQLISSVSSDLANVRITAPVNKSYFSEESWRILSTIITRYFKILETVDFNTGDLTTSRQVQNFQSSVIRTRVIMSSGGNSDQLTYAIKLISQEAYLDGKIR